jgi:hypothetical protein
MELAQALVEKQGMEFLDAGDVEGKFQDVLQKSCDAMLARG